jgi:integron integrase
MAKKLMETMREALRTKGYSYKTEQTYLRWIRGYVRFHLPRHPREVATEGVCAYITHLAVVKNYSPQTQNQALSAILFMYKVMEVQIGDVSLIRAKKEKHLPTVLTENEVMRLMENMHGVYRIMAELLYGGGLRLMECLRLRVKDVDFDNMKIILRDTKSNQDRLTLLPESVVPALKLHLAKVKAQHQEDLAMGYGEVELPYALANKYRNAPYEWYWQYVFPAGQLSTDPRSGHVRRHHIFETSLQKAVKEAARKGKINKHVTPHVLRHCFATHLYRSGVGVKEIQEYMGHQNVETTMIYIHTCEEDKIKSPMDRLNERRILRRELIES